MACNTSFENLAAFADGDLPEGQTDEFRRHVAGCEFCTARLTALRRMDGDLQALGRFEPSADSLLRVRRAVGSVLGRRVLPEIMTPEEVAQFLRVERNEVGDVLAEVPAFEIAGRVRVRRDRLLAWLAERERTFARQTLESEVSGILSGID
jgi:hypothetical protein